MKGEIDQILDKSYIHFLKSRNAWLFNDTADTDKKSTDDTCDQGSDSDDAGGGSLNRRKQAVEFSSSEEEE